MGLFNSFQIATIIQIYFLSQKNTAGRPVCKLDVLETHVSTGDELEELCSWQVLPAKVPVGQGEAGTVLQNGEDHTAQSSASELRPEGLWQEDEKVLPS